MMAAGSAVERHRQPFNLCGKNLVEKERIFTLKHKFVV
jgi:hypothetical protein